MTQSPKSQTRHGRHIEDLKKQIAECLERELGLLAEERSERARRLRLVHAGIATRPSGISARG
jgi:hypothetical protein